MPVDAKAQSTFSFVDMEHEVLDFWQRHDVFRRSLDATRNAPPYIFYDGPPFATGLPHHGHLVASVLKDVVPRYWTMKGRHVLRRFGWDCHGLPIEQEIDKSLGMSAKEAVAKLGVGGYNAQCRGIVERHVAEWRRTITRLGRWVDFDDDYKTMDAFYMESVWWVVKRLWDKGLVYQGFKVMPVSPALETVLANFEAGQNYLDVQDPAVTVLFRLSDEDAHLAAWTTTPWTLPSNLAVCVAADMDYVKVVDADAGKTLYLAEARLPVYRKKHPRLQVLERLKGAQLVGRSYQPLFDYFARERERGAFVVVADDYVTADEGTGLVHQAPAFGEDDHRVLREAGIDALVCPVTMAGMFTEEVRDFAGRFVKEADPEIIRALDAAGVLYDRDVIVHSYPHCYRTDEPLIYRAVPSWFVRVSDFRDDLVAANEQVLWVPGHIKHGRFGNWLDGAADWAISRNRVWGTPLPIWINDETGNARCVGSLDELEELTGVRVEDLHREHVDPLTFTVAGEQGVYRRVEEVLDCWFESGAMPYAQLHYPFENQGIFAQGFPAEYIAEGLDQTRGWFYTLMVLATALFNKPAFRNVIVNGLVLAEDGKKMSKSLRNYTPPDDLMEAYGADALRLHLINSGLVRAEEQRFADRAVRDMVRRALLPWHNAWTFLETYARIDDWRPSVETRQSDNILDQWILSKLQTLKARIAAEMERYRLYNVVPALFAFIGELTNWYIRLNRPRFWGEGLTPDKIAAYTTLHIAVGELAVAMAPFAPFLAEHIHQMLAKLDGKAEPTPLSVHLCEYPKADEALTKPLLEDAVTRMQQVIELGRRKREEVRIGVRTPLKTVTIIHRDEALLREIRSLENYVKAELNVKEVYYEQDEAKYIALFAKPNFPVLGKRLGKRMKAFAARIQALDANAIDAFQETGAVVIDGESFGADDIQVFREAKTGVDAVSNRYVSIALDCALNDDLVREGWAREVVRHIQNARKESGFAVSDRIVVEYAADGALAEAIATHREHIAAETLALSLEPGDGKPMERGFDAAVDEQAFRFALALASRG